MTEILCRWLNQELQRDPCIGPNDIPELFSSGYLFGLILHKHGIQEDFKSFKNSHAAEAKLNNFIRLESSFHLLNIQFDTNMAKDLMSEKKGIATRILYQLYVALQRKDKQNLTGQSLRCMKPSSKATLESMESAFFQGRMKQAPRQVDIDFGELVKTFQSKQKQREEKIITDMKAEEERLQKEKRDSHQKELEKFRQTREGQTQLYSKLKPIPTQKYSPAKNVKQKEKKMSKNKAALAEEVRKSISAFEATRGPSLPESTDRPSTTGGMDQQTKIKRQDSEDYMVQISKRAQDNSFAQKERERRRRKVLMDQMKALKSQEESHRQELLVTRMLRQSQQEQRIATQLMQIKKEKDNIRNTRIELQRQFEEQRQKDFEEYLKKEAELIKCENEEKRAQLAREREYHKRLLEEKALAKHAKIQCIAEDTLDRVLELAFKVVCYKRETEGLCPANLVRDWKAKFIQGQPLLNQETPESQTSLVSSSGQGSEVQMLLDNNDYFEYHECSGYWIPSDDLRGRLPPSINSILTHLVHKLALQVEPPKPPSDPPVFPVFPLRACCLGRPHSGGTKLLQKLVKDYSIELILVESLVEKAVSAYEQTQKDHTPTPAASHSTLVQSQSDLSVGASLSNMTREERMPKGDNPSDNDPTSPPQEASQQGTTATHTTDVDKPGALKAANESIPPIPAAGEPPKIEIEAPIKPDEMTWVSLGKHAADCLVSGLPIPDETLVQLLTLHLRELPDGTRWILSDFPTTSQQAVLLEMSLSGYVTPPQPPKYKIQMAGDTYLLIDCLPVSLSRHERGLDAVLVLDAESDLCLERGAEQASGPRPLQTQLAAFDEAWLGIEEFYKQFNNIVILDGNMSEDELYCTAKTTLSAYLPKQSKRGPSVPFSDTLNQPSNASLKQSSQTSLKQVSHSSLKQASSTSLKERSASSLKDPSLSSLKQASRTSIKQKKSETVSDQDQPPTATDGINQGESLTTVPTPKPDPEPEPGSEKWEYVEKPIPENVAKVLHPKWLNIEKLYVTTCVQLFSLLREGREDIYKHFTYRKKEFLMYLKRPDTKQQFVEQYQQDYNALQDHLRREDLMKAELHCKVDELCDKLWDICDHRKQEAEQERERVMAERWLEDKLGTVSNFYFLLIQAELTRFTETVQLQRDYYSSLEGLTPPELLAYIQVPLIEMPTSEYPETTSMQSLIGRPQSAEEQPVEEDGTEEVEGPGEEEQANKKKTSKLDFSKSTTTVNKKIILIPEKIPAPEIVEEKGSKKKVPAVIESPPPVDEPGEDINEAIVKHVTDKAVSFATTTVDRLVRELTLPELPSPDTPQPEQAKPEEKGKGKGDKKGKKTPVKKEKGGKTSKVPEDGPSIAPIMSADDLKKRAELEKMRKEEFASLKHEVERVKCRIELIKDKLISTITDFKNKSEEVYTKLEEWNGQQFKAEVDSVSKLIETLREAIEDEKKLQCELTLPKSEFYVEENALLFDNPPTPPSLDPIEEKNADYFTVSELWSMLKEFKVIAPSGMMPLRSFVELLKAMTNRSTGFVLRPSFWVTVQASHGQELGEHIQSMLSCVGSKNIDWRRFLMVISQPWPIPTPADIAVAAEKLNMVASRGGLIAKEHFMQVPIWLDEESDLESPFNRPLALKEFFFELFIQSISKNNKVQVIQFLLHFSADPLLEMGILKAFSVDGEAISDELFQSSSSNESRPVPCVHVDTFVKLHQFAFVAPQKSGSEDLSISSVREMFLNISGLNEMSIVDVLQNPVLQTVMQCWTKLYLMPFPERDIIPETVDLPKQ